MSGFHYHTTRIRRAGGLDRGVRALKALRQSLATAPTTTAAAPPASNHPDFTCTCGGTKYANQVVCRNCWSRLPAELRDRLCKRYDDIADKRAVMREALTYLNNLRKAA